MNTLSVPFHFTTTFLVAVGAFAGVWLALSRPEFVPRDWARVIFGLGWALLAVAETLHGAEIIGSDVDPRLLVIRSIAYFFLLISLLAPVTPLPDPASRPKRGAARRGDSGAPAGAAPGPPAAWGLAGPLAAETATLAVLAGGAGLAALRSRLQGGRRLALALGLLGASELLFAHGGAVSTNPDAVWFLAHGLHFLGGVALGWWLWRAFRISIQARFVAALVLLLILVIALVSSMVTQAFAGNVNANAFEVAGTDTQFVTTELANRSSDWQIAAQIIAAQPDVVRYTAAKSSVVLAPLASQFQGAVRSADFVAFFAADRSQLALSATTGSGHGSNLSEGEVLALQGSPEVTTALGGGAANAIEDIGLGSPTLALVGAAPVTATTTSGTGALTQKLVGVVAIGEILGTPLVDGIPLPRGRPVTVIANNGSILANNLPTAGALVHKVFSQVNRSVLQRHEGLDLQASVGSMSYYVVVTPLHQHEGARNAGPVVGAVMVTEAETPATQRNVSRTLFLGALAATLFAVGAAIVSGSRITRPIRDLTAAAERVRQGDLTTRVPVQEADEVGTLTEAFNQMTSSLDSLAGDLRESAFQESRIRDELEAILQSMTDGLVAVDKAGKVMTLNREAERITGVPAGRARGMDVEEVLSLVDAAGSRLELPVYRLGAGTATGFAAPLGDRVRGIPVAVTSTPITNDLGASSGAVAVLRDLTSDLEMEQMKTEFLSNISHELRTPLTPIKGYADLLRRKVVPRAKSVAFLNEIVASSERMERIVDMLVDFSAMQAGRLVLRTSPVNLDRATADLLAKWQEAAPNHTFDRTGFEEVPAVAGDARLLPRAIDELIDNAVKFSPQGGLVSLGAELDPVRPGQVRISVTDQGIGIPHAQMTRIVQDFVQVDASETRAFGGLGLGLAYVRRIIEAHNGELQVTSEAGNGSTFCLLVPIWRATPDAGVRGFPYRRPPREWPGVR